MTCVIAQVDCLVLVMLAEAAAVFRPWPRWPVSVAGETGGRRVRVRDVVTRTGAEYLVTETEDGQRQEWRLDLVRQLRRIPPRAAP